MSSEHSGVQPRTVARVVTVALMGAAVLVATVDGFAQSYSGLYEWALAHGLSGWKAQSFPLMIDLLIGVGELGLFLLAVDGHKLSRQALSWLDLAVPFAVAASGWAASLAFNVGAAERQLSYQVTAAVPPIVAMFGLLILLRTVHRYVVRAEKSAADELFASLTPEPAAPLPGVRTVPAVPAVPAEVDLHLQRARQMFADQLAQGEVPSIRQLKRGLRIGQPRAAEVRTYLSAPED